MSRALSNGPWFFNGYHLLVQKWEPQFVAGEEKQLKSAVWVRLNQLPTEFYDYHFIKKLEIQLADYLGLMLALPQI